MSRDLQEEIFILNSKVDQIGRIMTELFIMLKANEKLDSKVDQCIKSLNSISYKIEKMENPERECRPLIPPAISPAHPPLPLSTYSGASSSTSSSTSTSTFNNNNLFLAELKNKLKARLIT